MFSGEKQNLAQRAGTRRFTKKGRRVQDGKARVCIYTANLKSVSKQGPLGLRGSNAPLITHNSQSSFVQFVSA